MKPYGKKIGRSLKGSRFLDNGCPCCGREHSNKGSTRQMLKNEVDTLLKDLGIEDISITKEDRELLKKVLGRKT